MSATATAPNLATAQTTVVVDTTQSPFAALRPFPVGAVTITDRFWAPRRETNRTVTIPSQHLRNEETGRIANFRRAAGAYDGPFQGKYFNDSDVYKWLEAIAWELASGPDPALTALADPIIAAIAAAQEPDGYLNTYFTFERAGERWTNFDLHEMYCAGHLIQGAVAHYRATGSRQLLDVAVRFADYLCAMFGPADQGKREMTDGHEEIEMALVELYRATGERRYLEQAQFFIDVRGYGRLGTTYHPRWGDGYHQDHIPFRELDEMVGHAVRAIYYTCGAADVYAETGEAALLTAGHRLWADMTTHKLYVTGGVGSRWEGESFGAAYELPSDRAYTETCAAIASVMWNWRLFLIEGDPRYIDLLEHTLYNAVLPGVSLAGDTYFYQNPLADEGGHRREAWFGTACCPPNIARMLASLPGYVYATRDDTIWVNLYVAGEGRLTLDDGRAVGITQRTEYPWDGDIALTIDGEGEFAVAVRVPVWAGAGITLAVNGEPVAAELTPGTFVELRRTWAPGDEVRLHLPMPVRRVVGHPAIIDTAGREALFRGPLLYCLEGIDHPGVDLRDLRLPATAEFGLGEAADLPNGVVTLTTTAVNEPRAAAWSDTLYLPAPGPAPTAREAVPLTAIPYCLWANRAAGALRVWLPVTSG